MEVIDYSEKFDFPTNNCANHAVIFPKNIFCIIAGATGSGKTNLMVNLLLQESMINYADVHIYSKTLFQPAYVFFEKSLWNV
jgi:excinuclease UvrABC ATPase subunit